MFLLLWYAEVPYRTRPVTFPLEPSVLIYCVVWDIMIFGPRPTDKIAHLGQKSSRPITLGGFHILVPKCPLSAKALVTQ